MNNSGERALPSQGGIYAFRRIYDLVSQMYGGSERTVLDYGCGSGYGSSMLRASFGKVHAIDVEAETIDFCRAHYDADNITFDVFDPSRQPFPDASFDCVFSFQVFEHIPLTETNSYIRYVWNMLKPGGHAVITTPNANNYRGGHSGNPFHIKEYTVDEMRTAFQTVIPERYLEFWAVQDVPSTRIKNGVTRAIESKALSRLVGRTILLLQFFEARGWIRADHTDMLIKETPERVIGSHFVQVSKPEQVLCKVDQS